ncbi:hypothetical protein FSOLCH5_006469 [Fusarium solani]
MLTHEEQALQALQPQVVKRSITRTQALERAGDLVNQVRNPAFTQSFLKGPMREWLSEPVIRVLPMDLKKKHYYDERDEYAWEETVQAEQDVSFIVQGFGTSLAQQRETLAQEMDQQHRAMADTKDLEAL